MTTVIDHAIAIPTRPAAVWAILSDISNNPNWHPDSQRVQFLTTLKSGRGMRWRNTTKSNKEQVIEIMAWYDGLGYEYRIVDGTNYANNRGRIRLQESPEGTVLQWTFSYDTNGFFGNLRNNLSMKGSADKEIVQGLRNIYTLIKDAKSEEILDPQDSKSYLREAPNVEERATYQPRYPSKIASQEMKAVSISIDDDQPFKPPTHPADDGASIVEPPISEEDTRPNPTVQTSETVTSSSPSLGEPDFLKAMPDQAPADSLPMIDDVPDDETLPAPEVGSVGLTETMPADSEPETTPLDNAQEASASAQSLPDGSDPTKMDTATISVFELFGLEKPSQTEKVNTLTEEPKSAETADEIDPTPIEPVKKFMDSTPIIPDIQPEVPERRRGLRAALRSRFPKVRVPRSE